MGRVNRRRMTSALIALVIGGTRERGGLRPQPARAGRKGVEFDITASQFRDDCLVAGGEFADWGGGEYSCCFSGWCMECSKVTGRCRIRCDVGVRCVKASRLPGSVGPALDQAVNHVASVADAAPSSGPPHRGDATLGSDPAVVAAAE